MPTRITGRPLDGAGKPTDGPALEVDPTGRAMGLFTDSSSALASSPGMHIWSTILRYPEPSESKTPAMVVWLGPDATQLPAHVHTSKNETFRSLRGELTVVVDGNPERLAPGDARTIEPGDAHYFKNETAGIVAFEAEVPWTKTIDTQYMSAGLDQDGYFGPAGEYGEPGLVQGLLLAEYIKDETRITGAPRSIQRLLWATIGRIAKLTGRSAMDDAYLRDRFWEANVEQPDI